MLKNSVFHLRDVCLKDWKVTGIFDATEKELDGFQNLDPFHNIDSLATSDSSEEVDGSESEIKRDIYIYPFVDDNEESEFEDEEENIFDVFNEESDDE